MIVKKGNSEYLFVMGGKADTHKTWLKTTERLNLTGITKNNKDIMWEMSADMHEARSNFAATVIDNFVYVFGGISGKTETHTPVIAKSIECYDPNTNLWHEI